GHTDYIINGTIRLGSYKTLFAKTPSKNYHVYGEVRGLADPKVIGKAGVWISDMELDYTPTAIYRDSPLYLQGSTMTKPAQVQYQPYEEDFLDISLKTRAMLIEARMAYEHKDYTAAKALFSMAAQRQDGQDLGTYAGLYLANHKLGRLEEAEKAFAKVVSISVEKYRFLTVKYLFGVNSVDFLQDENLKARYDTWIRHIGQYFHNTNYCLRIVGHASRTGTEAYNYKLSLERAKSIQKRLQNTFPEVVQRSETVGRGFSENIAGIGTDDERDALDRRVELFIVDCK
ncbi:OmpA family protein, partial [Thermodesulfobacteriota bacterium]